MTCEYCGTDPDAVDELFMKKEHRIAELLGGIQKRDLELIEWASRCQNRDRDIEELKAQASSFRALLEDFQNGGDPGAIWDEVATLLVETPAESAEALTKVVAQRDKLLDAIDGYMNRNERVDFDGLLKEAGYDPQLP